MKGSFRKRYVVLSGGILFLLVSSVAVAAAVGTKLALVFATCGGILGIIYYSWNCNLEVIFQPTSMERCRNMLELANVHSGDSVYDLGCGDGRLLIMAARRFGALGTGVEIDPVRVWVGRLLVWVLGLRRQVRILRGNLYEVDLSKADAVFLYLSPEVNRRLEPKLVKELRPNARVISNWHPIVAWKPKEVRYSDLAQGQVYLYDFQSWQHRMER